MAIKIGSTTIPTTAGSIKVGNTNITKVNVVKDGITTTVWEVLINQPIYMIQNSTSLYNVTHSTHKATTDISDGLTYSVMNNGQRVEFKNQNTAKDIDIYIKFPIKTDSYLGKYLYMLGSFYADEIDESSARSSASLRLAIFDNNDNAVYFEQIAGIDSGGDDTLPESMVLNGNNSHLQIPSSGSYYIGYIIRANGAYGNKFILDISNLYIQ